MSENSFVWLLSNLRVSVEDLLIGKRSVRYAHEFLTSRHHSISNRSKDLPGYRCQYELNEEKDFEWAQKLMNDINGNLYHRFSPKVVSGIPHGFASVWQLYRQFVDFQRCLKLKQEELSEFSQRRARRGDDLPTPHVWADETLDDLVEFVGGLRSIIIFDHVFCFLILIGMAVAVASISVGLVGLIY